MMLVTARLLLVAHESALRSSFAEMFAAESFWKIATASDKASAIELLESHTFDVIVTDYGMPGGEQVSAAAAREQPRARRVLLTYSRFERPSMHAHHVVEKPLDPSELRAVVRSAVTLTCEQFADWCASINSHN